MSKHVVYIPGIGDHRRYGQKIVIQLWRFFGLTPHYFPLGWNIAEGFNVKQKRLLDLVEKLHSSKDSVSLVGISAGASAAVNTFAKSDAVSSVVCICGKINNPQTIGPNVLIPNPDFGESVNAVAASLASLGSRTKNIMSIHPWKDQTVPVPDTIIKGAKEKTLPGWSHISGIFFGVILGSRAISKFIRSNKAV